MSFWDKFKQGTRETFGGDRTTLPRDLLELIAYGEMMKKNYESLVNKGERFVTPDLTKRLTDKFGPKSEHVSKLPIYSLGRTLRDAGHDFEGFTVGQAYNLCGETVLSLADIEAEFEQRVYDGFLAPKQNFLRRDLKEGFDHYDKLNSRRRDYDAKKYKLRDAPQEKVEKYQGELATCQAKLDESVGVVHDYFSYLCDKDEQNGAQHAELMYLMQSMLDYHRASYEKLRQLDEELHFQDHLQHTPKTRPVVQYNKGLALAAGGAVGATSASQFHSSTNSSSHSATAASSELPHPPPISQRLQCRALYPFHATQAGDLTFEEGNVIEILSQEHGDWWEGVVNGRKGIFPANYVEIV